MMLLDKIKQDANSISFAEVIAYIEEKYEFIPTQFSNGAITNEAGQNNGSCKIFYFAKLQHLSPVETLSLFGDYYRVDVLGKPEGIDHQNIRNFMQTGWDGIQFEGEVLRLK